MLTQSPSGLVHTVEPRNRHQASGAVCQCTAEGASLSVHTALEVSHGCLGWCLLLMLLQRPDLVQFPGFGSRENGKEQGGTQGAGVSKYKKLWSEASAGEICRGSMAVLVSLSSRPL